MKTYSAKISEIQKKWFVIDATDLVLGRMATIVAKMLRGKHKASFTPHMDCGDNIIIINAEKVFLSGRKTDQKHGKKYYYHTGHPGGIKEQNASDILSGKYPERVVKLAVERMITRGPLGRAQLKNLYVYKGSEHKHAAQTPQLLDIASMNSKNSKK